MNIKTAEKHLHLRISASDSDLEIKTTPENIRVFFAHLLNLFVLFD